MFEADLSGSAADVADACALDDTVQAAHLRRQQLRLLARQATRSPLPIAIPCACVAYTVWEHASPALVGGWALALLALILVRRAYARRVLRDFPADASRALGHMVRFAFCNGLLTGATAPLFFAALPADDRALLTMILVCWTAGAIATAAAYARAFYAFVAPALLPIAVLWVTTGIAENVVLGVLVALCSMILALFVRDNERVVRDSFVARYETERLLEALERERQEVLLARHRAEEAGRAKARFLAAAGHDLRQPLHALSLYSAALKLRAPDGAAAEIAGHIDKALGSLSALVNSLLDISKLDAGVARTSADAGALDGAHVLVIEDEPAVRVGMRTLLESWGCRVAACSGIDEAERLLDDHGLAVDLIVADFRLPRHENGIETVRRLRARLGDVPALLVTGDTAADRLREAQASGLPVLHKPVSAERLRWTMLEVLRR